MEDPRISRMYWAILKQRVTGLFRGQQLMRSGMVTGLVLTILVASLAFAYRERGRGHLSKLKAEMQKGDQLQDAPSPKPGGQDPVVLTRPRLVGGTTPEFLSATMLPGRGMNILQITAYLPDEGEVKLMASPSLEDAAKAMSGRGDDADGQASLAMGAAFEAPWAGRISGVPSQAGNDLTMLWHGHTMTVPAASRSSAGSVALAGHMLAAGADEVNNDVMPDGGQVRTVFHANDFGAHWPSDTDVTVTVLMSSRTIDMMLTARNAGNTATPIGIGWHPRFAILGGPRGNMLLRLPAGERAEVRDRTVGLPTGTLLPVTGTPYDFRKRGGTPLGDLKLDDLFVDLHQELMDSGPVAELRDPAKNYGLRVVMLSPAIHALRVDAPPGGEYISLEPQFNYDDPFGREWGAATDTGMVVLQPGQTTTWKVRLELFALTGRSGSPI